jgi:hypothetical protein
MRQLEDTVNIANERNMENLTSKDAPELIPEQKRPENRK